MEKLTEYESEYERLRRLSEIAKLAHKFGSIEREFIIKSDESKMKSLNVEFKKKQDDK